VTEQEAKTKWCPFANSHYIGGNRGASDKQNPSQCRCIGSACMAWRTYPPEEWGKNEPPYHPSNVGIQPDDGFCGLAGKP